MPLTAPCLEIHPADIDLICFQTFTKFTTPSQIPANAHHAKPTPNKASSTACIDQAHNDIGGVWQQVQHGYDNCARAVRPTTNMAVAGRFIRAALREPSAQGPSFQVRSCLPYLAWFFHPESQVTVQAATLAAPPELSFLAKIAASCLCG